MKGDDSKKKDDEDNSSLLGKIKDMPTLIVLLLFVLMVGFVVGFYSNNMGVSTNVTNVNVSTNGGVFTPNEQKVSEIKTLMEKLYYLQSGNEATATVNEVSEKKYVLINITVGSQNIPVYIDESYENLVLFGGEIPFETYVSSVNSAFEKENAGAAQENTTTVKTDKPEVKLFVMAFCPYGNQAENAIKPTVNLLNDSINFEPVYIISKNANGYGSLHGQNELNQDIREKIIYNLYGSQTWMEYVYAINSQCTVQNIEDCWKTPAETLELNVTEIENEYSNSTMYNVLAEEGYQTSLDYGVGSSPTLIINNQTYSGQRTTEAYKVGICKYFTTEPDVCNETLDSNNVAASGNC